MTNTVDKNAVEQWLRGLQDKLCTELASLDGEQTFSIDNWQRETQEKAIGGDGSTRVLTNGAVFEQGGVNFSLVNGKQLPPAATAKRPELVGRSFKAMGVSLVMHPLNPHVPTSHMNVRFLIAEKEGEAPVWWFGGGYDLTPYYGYEEDCRHWHRVAKDSVGDTLYPQFKKHCDDYFFLKHRNEPRGIGGLFFDDFNQQSFSDCFAVTQAVGNSFINAYKPIVERRKNIAYTEQQRQWQLYRRGRYVEFNLVWDRGTLFGLQSGGRTESILMSMPPLVRWEYQQQPAADSAEAKLYSDFLRPRDWLEG